MDRQVPLALLRLADMLTEPMTMTRRNPIVNRRTDQFGPAIRRNEAFTLIELLVVISIISLLISILMPSLGRARSQAKGVHCVARLKDFGTALATYENISGGMLPPARWFPAPYDLTAESATPIDPEKRIEYGWTESLFAHVYVEPVQVSESYPVQRNIEGRRWQEYFLCREVGDQNVSSGHYRVYLPSWSAGSFHLMPGGIYGNETRAIPERSVDRDRIRIRMPLIGDANENSERGDGQGDDDCSYVDAGEANIAGSDGRNGNRFSDRHYGGTNYLFQDLHALWDPRLRSELARDFDLNGVDDIDTGTEP